MKAIAKLLQFALSVLACAVAHTECEWPSVNQSNGIWPSVGAKQGWNEKIVPAEAIYEARKGEMARQIRTLDVEQRRLTEAEITRRAIDFMKRSARDSKPLLEGSFHVATEHVRCTNDPAATENHQLADRHEGRSQRRGVEFLGGRSHSEDCWRVRGQLEEVPTHPNGHARSLRSDASKVKFERIQSVNERPLKRVHGTNSLPSR